MKLGFCPVTLAECDGGYSAKGRALLFDGKAVSPFLDFDLNDARTPPDIVDAMRLISVSGVQEKFPAFIDDGKIRIAGAGHCATHILKPIPWDNILQNRHWLPANEHLTMQLASQVYGIKTAACGLCFTSSGHPVFITRRFDVLSDGKKLPMEDFASVVERGYTGAGMASKYEGCYEDIADAIRTIVPAWKVDMERFFNLVVFNYIFCNGDAHLKNLSIFGLDGEIRLSPAYDLINTCLHVNGDDFGLDGGLSFDMQKSNVYERTGHPCRLDFERFGLKIGLPAIRISHILDKYMTLPGSAMSLIARSCLNDKLKRTYKRTAEQRISRFIRCPE